jgi:hypothetical protein
MFCGPVLNALKIGGLAIQNWRFWRGDLQCADHHCAHPALRARKYRAMSAASLLRRNLFIYGLGGIIIPFIGIKLVDVIIVALGLA